MRSVLLESLAAWWPEALLSLGALAVLILGVAAPRRVTLAAAWVVLATAAAALLRVPAFPESATFFGLILCDPFSLAFRWIALGTTALVLLMTAASRDVPESVHGEYLALLLFVAVGLMLMAEANHLLMAYLAMELVSLSSYALVGLPNDARASEAALKYLLFGALASGIMLFGMSLLFGLTGRLGFPAIQQVVSGLTGPSTIALAAAVGLVLVGLGFKISLVPFHQWTPDAYEGAPVPVAALLSVGPKAAGFALLVRLLEALRPAWDAVVPALLVLTVVTMTLGNLVALVQTNVKRLLAYSTIAQVGYLLIGVVAGTSLGREALLLYLIAYLVMNLGAFACVAVVVQSTGSEALEAFRGLSQRAPALAACCSLFLLSLAGIPPLVGFIGKFLLFGSALQAGLTWLALAAVLNSAVALYYYVNIIRLMYVAPGQAPGTVHAGFPARVAVTVCAVTTLALGLFPGALLGFLRALASLNLL